MNVVTTLEPEIFDVGIQGLGDPEPVEGKQRGHGVFALGADAGLDHESALVPVQAQGPGLVVDPRATDMGGMAAVDAAFLFAVPVEAGQR